MTHQVRVKLIDLGFEDCTDVWHGVVSEDTNRTCCGHALDSSGDFDWVYKYVKRGGITCKYCLDQIKQYKDIRL